MLARQPHATAQCLAPISVRGDDVWGTGMRLHDTRSAHWGEVERPSLAACAAAYQGAWALRATGARRVGSTSGVSPRPSSEAHCSSETDREREKALCKAQPCCTHPAPHPAGTGRARTCAQCAFKPASPGIKPSSGLCGIWLPSPQAGADPHPLVSLERPQRGQAVTVPARVMQSNEALAAAGESVNGDTVQGWQAAHGTSRHPTATPLLKPTETPCGATQARPSARTAVILPIAPQTLLCPPDKRPMKRGPGRRC